MIDEILLQTALKTLPYHGKTIREFASEIHIAPHTLYNYICGQRPSQKAADYIMFTLNKRYPAVLETAREYIKSEVKHDG